MRRHDAVLGVTVLVTLLALPASCGGRVSSELAQTDASVPVAGSGGTPSVGGWGGTLSGGSSGTGGFLVGGSGGTSGYGATGGAGGVGGSAASGGTSGFGATGGGGIGGSAAGGGTGGQPTCGGLLAGPAVELISFPTLYAQSPTPVLLPELSPPRVALLVVAGETKASGELRLARFTVSDNSASGVQPELGPMSVGSAASGRGKMIRAPGQWNELAIISMGGSAAGYWPLFGRVGINTWTASPSVKLAFESGGAEIAAGAGLAPSGTAWGGDGYGVAWRAAMGSTETVVEVIDPTGLPLVGPLAGPKSNTVPAVIWSGSTYLTCTPEGPGMQIASIRPPNGAAGDSGAVELGTLIPVPSGVSPGAPAMRRLGTDVIVAWYEKPIAGSTEAPRVRLARVSSDGKLLLDSGPSLPSMLESGVTLAVDGEHVLVSWSSPGDTTLADNMPGRSKIMVVRLPSDLKPPGVWVQIPATRFAQYGPPQTILRGAEGKLLTVWGGRSASSGLDVAYGARSDCVAGSADGGYGGSGGTAWLDGSVDGAPADGTPCGTGTICGKAEVSKIWKGGQCVDNAPAWKGGLPSCGTANAKCNTKAVCGALGTICHATWDCTTCCQ